MAILLWIWAATPLPASAGELAYSRLTEGFWQIWVYREGGEHRQLTTGPADKRRPRWLGEDGLLYRTNDGEIHRLELGGTSEPFRKDLWPALDPASAKDRKGVIVARLRTDRRDASHLVLVSSEEGASRTLTLAPGLYVEPDWSPDGSWIIFVKLNGYEGSELHRMRLPGGEADVLVPGDSHNTSPSISPDGRRVVYASNATGDFEIWTLEPGQEPQRLTDAPGLDTSPAFRLDGSQITFVTQRRGSLEIWEMKPDGANPRPLFEVETEVADPAWRPSS